MKEESDVVPRTQETFSRWELIARSWWSSYALQFYYFCTFWWGMVRMSVIWKKLGRITISQLSPDLEIRFLWGWQKKLMKCFQSQKSSCARSERTTEPRTEPVKMGGLGKIFLLHFLASTGWFVLKWFNLWQFPFHFGRLRIYDRAELYSGV